MRTSSRHLAGALLGLVCTLAACAQVDEIAKRVRSGSAGKGAAGADAGGGTGGAAGMRDAQLEDDAGNEDAGMPTQLCAYRMRSPGGGQTAPLAALVARGLGHALCACSESTGSSLGDSFETDAFDSSKGPYQAGQLGGDVGVNQGLMFGASSRIGGSLIVAGGAGVSLGLTIDLTVRGNLGSAGPLAGAANVHVDQDAEVSDRIDLADLFVGGTLTQPAGASLHLTGSNEIHAMRSAEVRVAAPCACDAASLLDVAAVVSQAPASAKRLSTTTDVSTLDGRCGEFVIEKYDAAGLRLDVRQPAAVYLTGDLHLDGDLVIATAAQADVDVFVGGNLKVDGVITLGTGDGHGRVRLYVGSNGTTQLGGGGELHGVLYAPLSEVVTQAKLTVYGAVLATRFATSAPLSVHYDMSSAR